MKIKIQFKDPDWDYNLDKDLEETLPAGLNDEEKKLLIDHRIDDIKEKLYHWIDCEYITIEFDTEAMTARVIPDGEQ